MKNQVKLILSCRKHPRKNHSGCLCCQVIAGVQHALVPKVWLNHKLKQDTVSRLQSLDVSIAANSLKVASQNLLECKRRPDGAPCMDCLQDLRNALAKE